MGTFNASGIVYTLMCSFCFSVAALLVKYLGDVNPVTIALWRFQGSFLSAIPLTLWHVMRKESSLVDNELAKDPPSTLLCSPGKLKTFGFIALRSLLACNSLVLHFYSLQYLDLGDALVIFSAKPIFGYALAYFFLKEPCGIIPTMTSITTLVGIVILVKPPFLTGQEEFDMKILRGGGLALTSMLLATMGYITLRHVRHVHYSKTMLAFGTCCTLENLILSLALGVFAIPQGLNQWMLAVGSTVASLSAYILELTMIQALKCEEAGLFTLIRSCDVIFGYGLQAIAFQILPDVYSIVGSAIVVGAVVLSAGRKWLGSISPDHIMRKRFWFILK